MAQGDSNQPGQPSPGPILLQGDSNEPGSQTGVSPYQAEQPTNIWLRLFSLLALSASIVLLLVRLADYDGCFQDPETFADFTSYALKDGNAVGLRDFTNCFNVWGLDGDARPRPVSYLCFLLGLKCRLALWQFVPMHPSFTPLWLLTLVVGPVLFYKFLRLALASTPLARIGTALYLSSPALLSSAVMLFHPAKPLANFALVLALYLAAKANARVQQENSSAADGNPRLPVGVTIAWILLMPVLLLADETVVFCLGVPVVWCPIFFLPRRLNWSNIRVCLRNATILAIPAMIHAVFVLGAMPLICRALFDLQFDFLSHVAAERSDQFDVVYLSRHIVELLTASCLPWSVVGRTVPVHMGEPWEPWELLGVYGGVLAVLLLAVRLQRTCWPVCKRAVLLTACSIVFTSYVSSHHELELVLAGFYYGGMPNILTVVLLTCLLAALASWRAVASWAVPAVTIYLLTVQACNFYPLMGSWREHRNYKVLCWLRHLPYNPYLSPDNMEEIQPLLSSQHGKYAVDTDASAEGGSFPFMVDCWRNRQAAPVLKRPLALGNVWVVVELYFMRGPADTAELPEGGRAGWEEADSPAARALQWQHVVAVWLALKRHQRQPGAVAMPVTALRRAPPESADMAAGCVGPIWSMVGHPLFASGLGEGLGQLRWRGYDVLIVETSTLSAADALPPSWVFHHGFAKAYQEGSLPSMGVRRLGEVRLAGRDMMVFELGAR